MDPTKALNSVLVHLSDERREDACKALQSLLEWLKKDGHFPNVCVSYDAYGSEVWLVENSHVLAAGRNGPPLYPRPTPPPMPPPKKKNTK